MDKKRSNAIFIYLSIALIVICFVVVLIKATGILSNKVKLEKGDNTSSISKDINLDNGDEDIDWSTYEVKDVKLSKSIEINDGAIYNLTGSISDGLIKIDTTDNVNLVLDNVSISNSSGPAIYVVSAKNILITLKDGTTSNLSDGKSYSSYDEDVNGVIYSKDDIIFDGNGKLVLNANYQDGIVSKDDLKIKSGTYEITSVDDGIRGKDSVYILDGEFNITAGGDGIKSTNGEKTDKGFVSILNGSFNITAELDGIQAETKLIIENGDFNIKTGGGSENSSKSSSDWGNWGRGSSTNSSSDTASAKGIKSGDNLVIDNGTFKFDTSDDSIHSNNYIGIKDGSFEISSGDDGIHADTEIIVDGGSINVKNSYEGIESAKMTINGGDISVVSSDDGINVAGGTDSSSMNRPGQNQYNNSSKNILIVNGGNIVVDSTGDGIDINGSGYIYGGDIVVHGPTRDMDAALDFDGEFVVNGGRLAAAGSSGMLEMISSSSTQNTVTIAFNSILPSGSKVTIYDSSNKEVISYTGKKTFSSLVASSSSFKNNVTYTIKVDDSVYNTFTFNSSTATVGQTGGMGGNGGRGQGGAGQDVGPGGHGR